MSVNVFVSPTRAFRDSFTTPNVESSLVVVLITSIFLSLATFLLLGNLMSSVFVGVMNIVQWIVFSALVWFFEFAHNRKRKKLVGVSFSQALTVVGTLWKINMVSALCFVIVSLAAVYLNYNLVFFIGVIFLLVSFYLLVFWVIASFKMLKVVFGAEKWKLLVNWVVLNLVNGLTISFITLVLTRFFLI